MKRLTFVLILLSLVLFVTFAFADNGLLGNFFESLISDNTFEVRENLKWEMTADEVYKSLLSEKHNGKNMCTDVNVFQSWQNRSISYVSAQAVLGNYKPMMYCYISDLWGLYKIQYSFSSKDALTEDEYKKWEEQTDEEFLPKYETLEKTLNYVYGMGERAIDKWAEREKLEDSYYIIKTSWSKGSTLILLECYKRNGRIELELEYDSPNCSDYDKRLEQDLKVNNSDMFYGF